MKPPQKNYRPTALLVLIASVFPIDFALCQNEADAIEPSSLMKHEARWLVQALEQAHFSKVSIEKLEPKEFLASFVKKLDKQKLYFTKQDIDRFNKDYSPTLITFFKQGNLFPGFEIYNEYKNRSVKRLDWAISWVSGSGVKLDTNETYNTDRENANWCSSDDELDKQWRKLVSFELLNETLSQLDSNASESLDSSELQKIIEESAERIGNRYKRWKKNILDFEAIDIQELYLTTLTQMFDPHTTFMNIKEKEKFDQQMNNEFVGIGAVLRDEDGFCTIKELLPGGPAEGSRELEPEDIILKVAQAEGDFVDVVDMKLAKIVELIKGPKDTLVRLEIKPVKDPSNTKVVRIVRDKIKLTANLASGSLHEMPGEEGNRLIGRIELPSFYGSTGNGPKATDDVEELINELKKQGAEGIILDLRRNGGGYLSEAVNLAGLFISRGPVVQVKSTDGKIRKKFDFNPKIGWDGPLIVLVSRYSASASEIVAGALQNHKRAIIVGDETTHGKGTVQSLIPMNLPVQIAGTSKKRSAAKITIQKYYLPSGGSTQIEGVKSDITMDTINMHLPIGESDLDNALAWDQIPAVNFRRPKEEFVYDKDNLEKLRELSQTRQKKLSEFLYLKENIDWFRKKRETKTISFNLPERIAQKKNDEKVSKELQETFKSFAEKAFPLRKTSLQVVKDQTRRSLEARGEEITEDKPSKGKMEKPTELDIRLHESIRIMADWLELLEGKEISLKDPTPVKD